MSVLAGQPVIELLLMLVFSLNKFKLNFLAWLIVFSYYKTDCLL